MNERFKYRLSNEQIVKVESVIGKFSNEIGYSLQLNHYGDG